MRLLLLLFICTSFVGVIYCRPQAESNESEIEEIQYENESEGASDDSFRDEDSRLSNQQNSRAVEDRSRQEEDQAVDSRLMKSREDHRAYQQHAGKFIAYDPNMKNRISRDDKNDDASELDKAYQTLSSKRRESDAYLLSNNYQPQAPIAQHLAEESIQDYNKNHMQLNSFHDNSINKRVPLTRDTVNFDDLPFETKEELKPRNEYVNRPAYHGEQPRFNKRYENRKRKAKFENGRIGLNRERRQVQESNNVTNNANNKDGFEENNANEDDETAIRRHIKKLSSEELEELLNTLSEDKRILLKKIIETDNEENINKREITKKAGAAEESAQLMESGQADFNKDQKSNENLESKNDAALASAETTECQKKSENVNEAETATAKSESANTQENHEEKAEVNDTQDSKIADENNNQDNTELNQQDKLKNENKRETNLDESNVDTFIDNSKMTGDTDNKYESLGNYYQQDDDLSGLVDESVDHSANKRDTNQMDDQLAESMKSLEESFPNSYDDGSLTGGNLAPHVRVKRNDGIKKRSAAVIPESKVAYVPYRAENEDEDNDEGNEFDDEGFYDRTSNLAQSKTNRNYGEAPMNQPRLPSKEQNAKLRYKEKSNIRHDLAAIGSDSDVVISSGIEGVNDNLMYNSAVVRNRRSVDEVKMDQGNCRLNRIQRSTPWTADVDVAKDNNYISFRAPQYQENDLFGALPRNYEGDLSRYKRIRRVKQFPTAQEVPSD